ncbi:helix-turn-helix domain-containing protein [Actinocorallia herbida]|uniref:helix-turn-helix domain-containing protein n=1 Tax=Actinocorallia herbida TaxID=58109 RepID=UPI000F4C5387|nr:helix-turn-helix transcriptional regulator [Actinocorallia herbida]
MVPPAFWEHPSIVSAVTARHFGQLIHAFRHHPDHVRPIPQATVARWLHVTQATISKAENGRRPLTDLARLTSWAGLLAVPRHLLWFSPSPETREELSHGIMEAEASESGDQMRRREFIAFSGTTVAAMSSDLLSALDAAQSPDRVSIEHIEQIDQAAALFSQLDHTYGGAPVRQAVTTHLKWAIGLLDNSCPVSLRGELFSSVGRLSLTCGWMAFDAYAHDHASAMLKYGLACAEEADDWHLRAKALSHLARQQVWCNDPDGALTHIDLALITSPKGTITATERAMLHTARARALARRALLGDADSIEGALRAIGDADDAFSHSDPATDPSWMSYYDQAQHVGDTGHALFDLETAPSGGSLGARTRLAEAASLHTDAYARSRAISTTKLATLLMLTGDPDEASQVAVSMLPDAGRIKSRRAMSDLAELSRAALPHTRRSAVADLREQIVGIARRAS